MSEDDKKKYFPKNDNAGSAYVSTRWKKAQSLKTLTNCNSFGAASKGRTYCKAERDAWAKEHGYQ